MKALSSINGTALHNPELNLTEDELQVALYNNIIYYSIMVPLAFAGNIFTMTAVIMVLKIKKNIPNLMIGVLACTDLFSVVTCHLISMASMANGAYIGTRGLCQFQSMMAYTYFKMGFLTKCCISLDRFIALAFPLRYRKTVTMKRVILLTVHNIIFSFGTSGLTVIIDETYIEQLPTWYMCVNDFQYYTTYKFVIVICEGAVFTLGVIIFFISNITVIKVVINLNKRRKIKLGKVISVETHGYNESKQTSDGKCKIGQKIKSFFKLQTSLDMNSNKVHADSGMKDSAVLPKCSTIPQQDGHECADSTHPKRLSNASKDSTHPKRLSNASKDSTHPKRLSNASKDNSKRKKQQKELQLAKLVTIIVSVFVLLWIPYMTVIYWEHDNRKSVHPFVEDIVIKLVFANCCINPLLYGVFNANFRKAYVYYIRMLAFYFTCKMTTRPQDIRYDGVKYGEYVNKKQAVVKFERHWTMGETTATDISELQHGDLQQGTTERKKSGGSLNQILENFHKETTDTGAEELEVDLDESVVVHAVQSLYQLPENSTDENYNVSLTVISA